MSILDPAIHLVGRLSFRNKMHATAAVFALPLVVALGVILAGLGSRVTAIQHERDALAVQLPALSLLVDVHQYLAASHTLREGAGQLQGLVQAKRENVRRASHRLETAIGEHARLADSFTGYRQWFASWQKSLDQADSVDADGLAELHSDLRTSLRGELDKLNEAAGLLVDGDTSSSRLLDIITGQLPQLIDNAGQAARLGAVVLVNQRMKSSRRTDLTLLRGNFNALVQWSMDGMQKVARERPDLAPRLDDASSRLNVAYLGVQEALTTKILDTGDFDMAPETFLEMTAAAFEQSLAVSKILLQETDLLLGERESLLQTQRNGVLVAMLLTLGLVIAGFVAAYISIMRGLNGLSAAVNTMASGDLSARVDVTTSDEIGAVGMQFNQMVESLSQRTALLREKTNDIQNMLHHMPQGILTIVQDGTIHPEYSDYLETIFETRQVKDRPAIDFIFGDGSIGADLLSQIDATIAACIGEDRMNFDFNSHLLVDEVCKTMPDGRLKYLELSWAPICRDHGTVEKIMVCVRDVSELRILEAEAEVQKRELQVIGQILAISQERFHEFIATSKQFVAENEALLHAADRPHPALMTQLFRNMHTIKGNARTYGLLHLTNIVHETEQTYANLRDAGTTDFDKNRLLAQLQEVTLSIDEYASLNSVKLGRKGPGRRGSAEKYVMVQREQVASMLSDLDQAIALHASRPELLVTALEGIRLDLQRIGTESIPTLLESVFASLPSLARELGKEAPKLMVNDHGIHVQNQIAGSLRNVFVHLYRNAIDHGIETIADRLLAGKPAAGTIELDLSLVDDRLLMRLRDDGKGLALAHIRRKATEKGLIGEAAGELAKLADESVAQLIFAAGFSTANAVTEVSGRGVGMDAVQDFVRREGGEIRLEFTDDNRGADFRAFATVISLPGKYAVRAPARPHAVKPTAKDIAGHTRPEPAPLDAPRTIVVGTKQQDNLATI